MFLFTMVENNINDVFLAIGTIGPVLIGIAAIFSYRLSLKIRKAEWLSELYHKFYENKDFREIRRILDYNAYEPDKFNKLKETLKTYEDIELVENFVNYLNFFEFICVLREMKQLTTKEINYLFQYYIENLKKHKFVKKFLEEQGFECTLSLLNKNRC